MALQEVKAGNSKYGEQDFTFETKGEKLEGHLVDRLELTNKKDNSKFFKHIVKTKDGHYGVIGGKALQSKLGKVALGTLVSVTYLGMVKQPSGNRAHDYTVQQDKDNTIEVSSTATKSALDVINSMRAG
jgi:hypothetical protein